MMYTVNGTEYDSNSPVNQKILNRFCDANVYLDMTAETEFIIHYLNHYDGYDEKLPFDIDDYDDAISNAYDSDDPDADIPEVYVWYAVSSRLAELLKYEHEIVIETYDKCLWGRQTYGQSVTLDSVIQRIAIDRKILEGHEYSWESRV